MAYAFGMGHGFGFGLGFLNFIGTLLFILLIIWGVKMFLRTRRSGPWSEWRGNAGWRWDGPQAHGAGHPDEAMSTARERLAKGELSAEEFETIKQGLGASSDAETRHDSALRLARLRFAKGELTPDEFAAVKKALLA